MSYFALLSPRSSYFLVWQRDNVFNRSLVLWFRGDREHFAVPEVHFDICYTFFFLIWRFCLLNCTNSLLNRIKLINYWLINNYCDSFGICWTDYCCFAMLDEVFDFTILPLFWRGAYGDGEATYTTSKKALR